MNEDDEEEEEEEENGSCAEDGGEYLCAKLFRYQIVLRTTYTLNYERKGKLSLGIKILFNSIFWF